MQRTMHYLIKFQIKNRHNKTLLNQSGGLVLFATKTTTCYAGGKGKALARKEVTK